MEKCHLFFWAEALRHTENPPQSPYQWNGNKPSTLPTKRQLPFLTFFCWRGHPKGCRRLKCNEKLTLWMSNFWFFCQRTLGSRVMDGFLGSTSFGNASKLGIHPVMMPWAAHTKSKRQHLVAGITWVLLQKKSQKKMPFMECVCRCCIIVRRHHGRCLRKLPRLIHQDFCHGYETHESGNTEISWNLLMINPHLKLFRQTMACTLRTKILLQTMRT